MPNTWKYSLCKDNAVCWTHFFKWHPKTQKSGPSWLSSCDKGRDPDTEKRHAKPLPYFFTWIGGWRWMGDGRVAVTFPNPWGKCVGQSFQSMGRGWALLFSFRGYMKTWPLSLNTEVNHFKFFLLKNSGAHYLSYFPFYCSPAPTPLLLKWLELRSPFSTTWLSLLPQVTCFTVSYEPLLQRNHSSPVPLASLLRLLAPLSLLTSS